MASFPKIFYLLKNKFHGTADDNLEMLASIPLSERPSLVVRLKHPKRHV